MVLQIEAVDVAADGLDSNGGHSTRYGRGQPLQPWNQRPSDKAVIHLKLAWRTKTDAKHEARSNEAALPLEYVLRDLLLRP